MSIINWILKVLNRPYNVVRPVITLLLIRPYNLVAPLITGKSKTPPEDPS